VQAMQLGFEGEPTMEIIKGDVISEGTITEDCHIGFENGEILYVGKPKPAGDYPVRKVDGYICPGFVDTHLHGVDGYDFMDQGAFKQISTLLPKYGVTSFLATSRTAGLQEMRSFLDEAQSQFAGNTQGAHMLGVHLEGPWINEQFAGAQNKNDIQKLITSHIEELIVPYRSIIKKITLAPEKLDDMAIIKKLSDLNIEISAGHTAATIDELEDSMKYGLKYLTHTFNAMSPIHHRKPGVAGAGLYFNKLICEVIADGIHVHPKIVELLYRNKGKEKMILVSDCTGYNLLREGDYNLRGKELVRVGDRVSLKNGSLAGSIITMDGSIKYLVEHCNIPLEEAIFMATETPLNICGPEINRGKIKIGYKADLVILTEMLQVQQTIINGTTVHVEKKSNTDNRS
jgi:N-acetylglucosamine-6-phosphate deacetylase